MKCFLIILLTLFFTKCSNIRLFPIQISKNENESIKRNIFIKRYHIVYCTDSFIQLQEAWVEKALKYEEKDGEIIEVPAGYYHLCFMLRQNSKLKYKLDNYYYWHMKCENNYVGLKSGIYCLYLGTNSIPKSICLDLVDVQDDGNNVKQNNVGYLQFLEN